MIFLIENIHKELNVKQNKELDENEGYLIKRKEDKTNKADMVLHFLRYFKENFNSIISKTFFGIMKNRNNCKQCGLITYSFNCFCLLYFDIEKLNPNNSIKKIPLIKFFEGLNNGIFSSNSKKQYFCKGCSKQTEHGLQKAIYYMPNSLIICFRDNYKSDISVEYPDSIDLNNEKEYPNSPGNFTLKGFINKIKDNGKERYISYFKSPDKGKIFSIENYNIKEEKDWNKNNGKTVMLFYEAA